jgi:IclR family mhp operon transcriptional activator
MKPYKVKSIEALARGAEVLQLLHARPGLSLHNLHVRTGIAKSTLTRILLTLHREGLVWQRLGDGAYLPTGALQQPELLEDRFRIAEIGSPLLQRLGESVPWPSILSVPRATYMEVVETNGMQTYFNTIERFAIGFHANMLSSASGRAFLGFCSERQRRALIDQLRQLPEHADDAATNRAQVRRIVEQVRRDGFGLRAGHYERAAPKTPPADDNRESLALPILCGDEVVACLSLTWKRGVQSLQQIQQRYLPELRATARALEAALAQASRDDAEFRPN